MQAQGQSPSALQRVSHAGLLCVYTLAAVLGLFLHSPQENRPFAHVCGVGTPDLDNHDAPAEHDEAKCALCHVHARLGIALPPVVPALHAPLAASFSADAPRSFDAPSAFLRTPPSRGPPLSPAV